MLLHYVRDAIPVEIIKDIWALESNPICRPENYNGFKHRDATHLMVHLNEEDRVAAKIEYAETDRDVLTILILNGSAHYEKLVLSTFERMARQCGYCHVCVSLAIAVEDTCCRLLNLFQRANYEYESVQFGKRQNVSFALRKKI